MGEVGVLLPSANYLVFHAIVSRHSRLGSPATVAIDALQPSAFGVSRRQEAEADDIQGKLAERMGSDTARREQPPWRASSFPDPLIAAQPPIRCPLKILTAETFGLNLEPFGF